MRPTIIVISNPFFHDNIVLTAEVWLQWISFLVNYFIDTHEHGLQHDLSIDMVEVVL